MLRELSNAHIEFEAALVVAEGAGAVFDRKVRSSVPGAERQDLGWTAPSAIAECRTSQQTIPRAFELSLRAKRAFGTLTRPEAYPTKASTDARSADSLRRSRAVPRREGPR